MTKEHAIPTERQTDRLRQLVGAQAGDAGGRTEAETGFGGATDRQSLRLVVRCSTTSAVWVCADTFLLPATRLWRSFLRVRRCPNTQLLSMAAHGHAARHIILGRQSRTCGAASHLQAAWNAALGPASQLASPPHPSLTLYFRSRLEKHFIATNELAPAATPLSASDVKSPSRQRTSRPFDAMRGSHGGSLQAPDAISRHQN